MKKTKFHHFKTVWTHSYFVLLFVICNYSFSQSPKGTTGNWLMFFNQTRLSQYWSMHTEAQYRSFEITPNTEQILLRTGINYHINNSAFASIGYAFVPNYTFDKERVAGIQASENRLWQQLLMRSNIGRFLFEHRYRLEQRWIVSSGNNRYLNRLRYLLRASVLLNKKTLEKNTLFLSFYDEIFVHFSTTAFDRNRFYGAIGYQFNSNTTIQIGYLAQTVNISTKYYMQAALIYNLDLRPKGE